jgi:acetyltransferase
MTKHTRHASADMFEAEASLFTRSGDKIHLRPVRADDRPLVAAFFKQLSPEDLRNRFLTTTRDVDAKVIERLCRADYPASMTFLAFHDEELIATGTLTGNEDGRVEVALSTVPRWKHHGVSWALFGHVVNYAERHGAREIVSIERSSNRAAITLEHEMGFGIRLIDASAGEVIATKSL